MKKKTGFFGEFKKFITRGNVLDMSVGVIVGGAFTSIVNGMSNFILKPIINYLLKLILGKDSLSEIFTFLDRQYKQVEVVDEATGAVTIMNEIDLANSIYIDWGAFINAVINFLLIAFVLFFIVKTINKISESHKRAQDKLARIEYKQKHGFRLSKKEQALLAEEEARKAEEARIAAEEAAKPVPVPEDIQLLSEIRDLLKK